MEVFCRRTYRSARRRNFELSLMERQDELNRDLTLTEVRECWHANNEAFKAWYATEESRLVAARLRGGLAPEPANPWR